MKNGLVTKEELYKKISVIVELDICDILEIKSYVNAGDPDIRAYYQEYVEEYIFNSILMQIDKETQKIKGYDLESDLKSIEATA